MDNSFDEAYARYLNSLAMLDKTDDIAEKNLLFRQLAELLSEMESRLHSSSSCHPDTPKSSCEESELIYWI